MPLPHTPRRSAFLKGAQLVVILEGDHNVSRAPPAPAEVALHLLSSSLLLSSLDLSDTKVYEP